MLLNRPERKLGQHCTNSWHKIDWHANKRHACFVLLCAMLTPLNQKARKPPGIIRYCKTCPNTNI